MLRILIEPAAHETTLRVEGRLAGPWVDELARVWAELRTARDAEEIRIDLDGVTFVGSSGKLLLGEIHRAGSTLAATGCMIRGVVDEVTAPAEAARRRASAPRGSNP